MSAVRFADPELDGQLGRTLYAAYQESSDLGEALAVTDRLGPSPTYGQWFERWSATGDRGVAYGQRAADRGHRTSARRAFLRAAEYYRQAIYFVRKDLTDQRLLSGYHRHRAAFRAAAPLADAPIETITIPYQDTSLAGYLARPAGSTVPARTLIFPCGYDSTAEAGWAASAADAVARGNNAVLFDGPGQGSTLYEKGIAFRHDFEEVLTPVLDWLVRQPGVDASRLVVIGRSFAGYLAPRGVAFDDRVAALVCDPGQYEPGSPARFATLVGQQAVERALAGNVSVDAELEPKRTASPELAELLGSRMSAHGVHTLREWIVEMQRWTLEGVAHKIACPTLVVQGEHDPAGQQSRQLYDALICPKRLEVLSAEVGADGHCGGLGQMTWSQVVYDWLDETVA